MLAQQDARALYCGELACGLELDRRKEAVDSQWNPGKSSRGAGPREEQFLLTWRLCLESPMVQREQAVSCGFPAKENLPEAPLLIRHKEAGWDLEGSAFCELCHKLRASVPLSNLGRLCNIKYSKEEKKNQLSPPLLICSTILLPASCHH